MNRYARVALPLMAAVMLCPGAIQAQEVEAPACRDDPKFREQDFTVGHWDVYRGEEKSAEVRMDLVLADCFIHEIWSSNRPNGDGQGYFAYSRALGDWTYLWLSESGYQNIWRGELIEPGNMRYVSERALPEGGVRLRHWSLILQPDGSVRELSVGTEDGGETWSTEYDLRWVKKD